MFCTKCGKQLSDNARFCTNCGTPVPEKRVPRPEGPPQGKPEAGPTVPPTIPPAPPTAPVTPPAARPIPTAVPAEKPKKSKAPLIAAAAVLLVAALGVGGWWFFLRNTGTGPSAEDPAQTQQGEREEQREQETQGAQESQEPSETTEPTDTTQPPETTEPAAIDYTRYAGSFYSANSLEDYFQSGGPLVELSVEGSSLNYTLTNVSASCYQIAELSGSAPLDGSSDVAFSGTDSCGNAVSGTIYLLADGAVAVEAAVTAANAGAEWSVASPYRELVACGSDFTTLQAPESTQELVVTSSGSTATMTLRNWNYGHWTEIFTANAYVGSNGVTAQKREGDKATPAGTFHILFAFGTATQDLSIPYTQIQSGDVWVDDTSSHYYNTLQHGGTWRSSEDLYDKFTKGRSVACIYFDFNGDGHTGGSAATNGGSDLFIDGVGSSGKLASGYGDIKISGSDMLTLLPLLDSSRNPVVVIS